MIGFGDSLRAGGRGTAAASLSRGLTVPHGAPRCQSGGAGGRAVAPFQEGQIDAERPGPKV